MYFLIFFLWTIFWSLWSVLLTRLEDKTDRKTIKWILFWFSKCPHCNKRLQAKNLIPLISFFVQKWKCSFCKKKISWQYPLLEVASWLIFMFSYYIIFDKSAETILYWYHRIHYIFLTIANWWLLLLLFQDIKKQELHMPIRIGTTARILIRQFIWAIGNYQQTVIWSLLVAWICAIIYFWAKRYIKIKYKSNEEWFWQWDIFLWFTLWAMIPLIQQFNILDNNWQTSIEITISLIFIAAIIWLFYVGGYKISKKELKISIGEKQKLIIPFFPCLIISFWIILLYGKQIISYLFL